MSDNDKIERKYKRVRIRLMRDKDFAALGPVMRVGTQRLEDNVPTAYTDGVNETYGRAFVDALEEAPLAFVILHETYHKMCRHLVTYRKLWEQSPKLANMATDYWINGKLDTLAKTCTTIELPRYTQALLDLLTDAQRAALAMEGKGLGSILGLLDHKYDGMTVPEIFRELKQEQEQGGGGGGGGGEGGGGFDEHGWEEGNAIPKEKMEEIRSEIERAVREGQMIAKRMGNGSLAAELGFEELLTPKVDWRAQLRDFVRSTCRKPEQSTFRRPNRRFLHQGIIMPTMQGKAIKRLGYMPDASGSMFCGSPTPFHRAMSELEGLVKQLGIEELHLIYWDGAVCQHELYTPATVGNWLNVTRPKGGGGTDPACITPWLKEKGIKLDAAVVLTDGEVPGWGTWTVPVLWTICNKTKHVAKVGKTIHLED
jgi:predicted metal-dependent peptidase